MAGKISVVALRGLLIGGWIALSAGLLRAQQLPPSFEFRHIQEKDGLSFNFVNCFLRDRDGFLWVGTYDGLNRYDGSHFNTFKHQHTNPNGLLNNAIQDLSEDQNGVIWMAVEGGISGYDKKTGLFQNIHVVNGSALGLCNNVLCDRNGNVWFTSRQRGLFCYQLRTKTVREFPHTPANDTWATTSRIVKNGLLLDAHQNGLWIATGNGLNYFDINKQQFHNYHQHPPQQSLFNQHDISALALDGDQRLIFSDNTTRQIVIYDLTDRRILKTITPVSQSKRNVFNVATIFVDRQHNLWTSSWSHVLFYVEANTYRITELLHDDAKHTTIAADFFWGGWQHPDGSVWLGTVNGISYTNPGRALYDVYDLGALFPALNKDRGILSFLEDDDGSWWLGTATQLLHYLPTTNHLDVYKLPNGTPDYPYGATVSGLQSYGNDLYVVTEQDIFIFHKPSQTFSSLTLPKFLREKRVPLRSIVLQQDSLWVFGESKQTFCYQLIRKQWKNYPIPSAYRESRFIVAHSLLDQKGGLWLELHPVGLAHFLPSKGRFERLDIPQGAAYENTIASLRQDTTGAFWMASNGYGLLRYEPRSKRLSNWTESEGLAYDYCGSALPDQRGNVWIGAYNKMSVFTVAKNRFRNLTLPLNESTVEYTTRLFPLRNGHILSTQKAYLVALKPEKLGPVTVRDTVLISALSMSDTTYLLHNTTKRIELEATSNAFSIQYSALAALNESLYRYLHKLEGYDDRWLEESSWPGIAVYGKLPGGDYIFKVKGIGVNGAETPVSTLAVHIDTLFYKSIWFWTLIGLLLAGLLYAFIRYRYSFIQFRAEQASKLNHLHLQATRLERDKAEIHYQNLINHLNPHFLFNSLTSLNSLINTTPKEASVFLRKLSAIYRYILQNKDKELISLGDELAFAQNYIDLQKSRFDDGLQIQVDVRADCLDCQIVPVTIQNLLENAVKHNVIMNDNPLRIRVYTEAGKLYIVNNLQKKAFVETSNNQGLASLKSLYHYLSKREIEVNETATDFIVIVPLL